MNWFKLIELPLQEFALAHYREALRLGGVTDRGEIGKRIKEDFPNGGLSEYLRELGSLTLDEIGLFFFYYGAKGMMNTEQYSSLNKIYLTYSFNFSGASFNKRLQAPRQRFYYLSRQVFNPLICSMLNGTETTEWRTYLDMCVGKEVAA